MTTARQAHLRGQLMALRSVRKWIDECRDRNIKFQVEQTAAPKWMLLSAKYGALTQEAHIQGLDARIAKVAEKLRRLNEY